jgi:tRNA threonylcarbamoyladenosine modification (KEOPS) complex  Pcc1 subunit
MNVSGTMEIAFESALAAQSAYAAMSPESGTRRAKAKKSIDGNKLIVFIEAKDAVAYRAIANGIMRNLQLIEGIEEKNEVFE